jgi:hypothetical protein
MFIRLGGSYVTPKFHFACNVKSHWRGGACIPSRGQWACEKGRFHWIYVAIVSPTSSGSVSGFLRNIAKETDTFLNTVLG